MALEWTDLVDNIDDVKAEHINKVAHGVQDSEFYYQESKRAADKAEAAAEASRQAARAPYIGENGNWYEWNEATLVFADSGVKAQGNTGGIGPTGKPGTNGLGVPAGGGTGQYLRKKSEENNDTEWADSAGGKAADTSITPGLATAIGSAANVEAALTEVNIQLSSVATDAIRPYQTIRIYAEKELCYADSIIYKSLQAGNIGNAVTDSAWWLAVWTDTPEPPLPEQVIHYHDDPYTKLLMHFDNDVFDATKIHTPVNTNVTFVDGKFSKAGNAGGSTNQYADVASSEFNLGADDFTFDFWFKPNYSALNGSTGEEYGYFGTGKDITAGFSFFTPSWGAKNNIFFVFVGHMSTWSDFLTIPYSSDLMRKWSDGNYHHVELSRQSSTFRIFVDGELAGERIKAGAITNSTTGKLRIHSSYAAPKTGSNSANGAIEEFRFSKGICRHASNFEPPKYAYVAGYEFDADDYTALLQAAGITTTYANAAALVADSAAMNVILSNERAVRTLTRTCTGDLMVAILQSPEWITAIKANETARRIIMANPHWARFVAVMPSCEPLLNYTMLYDQGDEQNAKTGGWVVSAFGTDSSHNGCMANTLKSLNITSYDEAFVKVGINAVADGGGFGSDERTRIYFSNTQQGFAGHNLIHTEPRIESVIPSELNKIEIFCKSTGLSGLSDGKLYLSTGAYANSSSGRSAQKNENDLQWYFPYHTPNKKIYYHFYEIVLLKPDPYQLWLTAAGITTQYADLAAVLADSSALSILMSNEAAIEYMISCSGTLMAAVCQSQTAMTALCNNIAYDAAFENPWWKKFMLMCPVSLAAMKVAPDTNKVPTMTNYTVPIGEVIRYPANGTIYSGREGWRAFDHPTEPMLESSPRMFATFPTPYTLGLEYVFTSNIILFCAEFRMSTNMPAKVTIYGSIDGVSYDILYVVNSPESGCAYTCQVRCSKAYSRYKIAGDTNFNGNITYVQFYGKAANK